jgi:peptide deformylase
VASYEIRVFGDPVLRQHAKDVESVDEALRRLARDMIETMYKAPGVGLAAPQIGVERRMFVYDLGEGDGPKVLINPRVLACDGEWVYEEGCLSVPELYWPIVRPKQVHVVGQDLDGNEIDLEADTFHARVLQHEIDHLDGVLLLERLDPDLRREAMRVLRGRVLTGPSSNAPSSVPPRRRGTSARRI